MSFKVCETCAYSQEIPKELYKQFEDIINRYPKAFFCIALQEVKVYNPDVPSQCFDCPIYEPKEEVKQ
jgi:hypothetical protein